MLRDLRVSVSKRGSRLRGLPRSRASSYLISARLFGTHRPVNNNYIAAAFWAVDDREALIIRPNHLCHTKLTSTTLVGAERGAAVQKPFPPIIITIIIIIILVVVVVEQLCSHAKID